MRANIVIMWILAIFFVLMSVVYTLWHMAAYGGAVEWAGTFGLGLSAVLAAFIAVYLMLVHRGQQGQLPEDMPTAEIDDGDPELGHFSPWSWWPILLAAALSIVFMGFAISTFMIPIGIALTLVMLVGWVYEYYRGNFAR